jgi:DNA-binding MarR family transcriptional regulator
MPISSSELDAIEAALAALHRASYQHRAWEDLCRDAGITLDRASATLLKTIAHCPKGQCRMQDAARILGIEAPSVSRTVHDLENAGLLQRQQDAQDKRVYNLSVTKAGSAQLNKLRKARRAKLSQVFESWTTKERHEIAKLLQKFSDQIGQNQEDRS